MMLAEPKTRLMTPEEYLIMERASELRHEYFRGEVREVTGASREHNLIVMSIGAELYRQLRKRPCEIYATNMRVKVSATGLYTYPDVIVVCEKPQLEDEHFDTLLNPTVIIEVLSDSTEDYDRGDKFARYRKLDSLTDYLLVAPDRMHIEYYARQQDGVWLFSEADQPEATISIASIACELVLEEIYEKIKFE
jgi:Uma2 family endonuclease